MDAHVICSASDFVAESGTEFVEADVEVGTEGAVGRVVKM